jgi:hypothetical protein
MSDETENRLLVARMLRRQRQMDSGSFQFSLRLLFITITFFCFWLGLVCLLTALRPAEVPLSMHYWITALWACIIIGALLSQSAWYYFLGGAIGSALVSPLTLMIFVHDRWGVLPLATFWWMSFVFATCACLSGGIDCLRRGKVLVGVVSILAFVGSIVGLVVTG